MFPRESAKRQPNVGTYCYRSYTVDRLESDLELNSLTLSAEKMKKNA